MHGTMRKNAFGIEVLGAGIVAMVMASTGGCGDGASASSAEAGSDAPIDVLVDGGTDAGATPADDAGGDAGDAGNGDGAGDSGCPANFCACTCQDGGAGYRPQCDAVHCTSSDPCISGLDADGGWLVCGL
jgi:hypothetical protein